MAYGTPAGVFKVPCADCKVMHGDHKSPICLGAKCKMCGYFEHKPAKCKHNPRSDFRQGGGGKHSLLPGGDQRDSSGDKSGEMRIRIRSIPSINTHGVVGLRHRHSQV